MGSRIGLDLSKSGCRRRAMVPAARKLSNWHPNHERQLVGEEENKKTSLIGGADFDRR